MYSTLSDADIAIEFSKVNLISPDDSAEALVRRVRAWLAKVGLAHRDPYDIASEALRLTAAKPAPAPAPPSESAEPPAPRGPDPLAAFSADVQSGISDLNAEAVRDMSMQEFAKLRAQIGLGQSKGVGIMGRLQ